MSIAAQPVDEDDGPLSPWWLRAVLAVMLLGFSGLIMITMLSYRNAPPVPARTIGEDGALAFSGDDVRKDKPCF
ncbi:MAG: nitric oxide reductase large subunit [Herminiimonas sp.]|nr:nitric oxide reductase large subunit [Herminiimonas sp.]